MPRGAPLGISAATSPPEAAEVQHDSGVDMIQFRKLRAMSWKTLVRLVAADNRHLTCLGQATGKRRTALGPSYQ